MKNYKKIQLMPYDLSKKTFEIYSNSDFVFYIDDDGRYWCSENSKASPYEIGTLQDIEEYLLLFEC